MKTTIARHYGIRLILMGILCVVFGVWGIIDYFWRYPDKIDKYDQFVKHQAEFDDLQAKDAAMLSDGERSRYAWLDEEINRAIENEENQALHKYDRPLQWAFILCLPFGLWSLWQYQLVRSKVYELDDAGNLHLPGGETWPKEKIADIDMNRWMAKSMAWVVHEDGRRELLDDYKHRNLHLIVGALASEKYPEEWDADAKPIKKDEPLDEEESADGEAIASADDEAVEFSAASDEERTV